MIADVTFITEQEIRFIGRLTTALAYCTVEAPPSLSQENFI